MIVIVCAMNNKAPKSQNKPKILYGENDQAVMKSQTAMLEQAGYAVQTAIGRDGVQRALTQGSFDLIVLGHSLSRDDRHHLPYMAKKADENTPVLVLHASGKHPQVDAAIDSRSGARVVLEVVADLIALKMVPAVPVPQATSGKTLGRR